MNCGTVKLVLPTNYELIREDDAKKISGGLRVLSLNKGDIEGMLFAAATAGPLAMQTAITSFMTMAGGPAGTVAGIVVGILGAGGLGNLCYLLIQAYTNDQTFYMDVNMNGIFPNISMGVK